MEKSKISLIAAILVAGAMIAGAIIYSQKMPGSSGTAKVIQENAEEEQGANTSSGNPESIWEIIEPVTEEDHVLGSPNAKLTLVLYSDIECPYCKKFHETMKQAIEEYGKDGTLMWVYRHFPLEALHPTALKEAEATECAAELGGNQSFWDYMDKLVEASAPFSQDNLTNALADIAKSVGLNRAEFVSCLDSGRHAQKIKDMSKEVQGLGAQGTPFSIIINPNGKIAPIPGALPYADLKEAIETVLNDPSVY